MENNTQEVYSDVEKAIDYAFNGQFVMKFYDYLKIRGTKKVEVEEILYANQLDEKIIVAKVVQVDQHPDADRLKLAQVDTASGIISIVCGAPNITEGMTVALAQVGTTLPSGDAIGEAGRPVAHVHVRGTAVGR